MKPRYAFILFGTLLAILVTFIAIDYLGKPKEKTDSFTSEPRQDVASGEASIFYPVTRYSERLTVRPYGTKVQPNDNSSLPCGDQFEGLHTADDTEAIGEETISEVPVFAIADGFVRQVGDVNGYGGLIVIEHELQGKSRTVYYGHIDLSQTKLRVDDRVKAGDKITYLGDHCSSESSDERKHLHFGIHQDPDIDVRGYVPSRNELSNWLNPREILKTLNAKEPIP